jgi:carbon-monoxide dehydrogenase medium subunit
VKPVAFDYARPADLAGAVALGARDDIVVKYIAGGQSLGPMLNLRLVQPDLLVDLTAIPELIQVDEQPDALLLGACITHADIEDSRVPDVTNGVLPAVAGGIAYRAVRNRGTIGGSLSHADPAADWVACLTALGAGVVIRSAAGRRTVAMEKFMVGVFETALAAGELVEAISIPRLSASARWGWYKICRKSGDFADAIGAVLLDPERGVSRAVIGAIEARPILLSGSVDGDAADAALRAVGRNDPIERQIHVVALRRAAAQAGAA